MRILSVTLLSLLILICCKKNEDAKNPNAFPNGNDEDSVQILGKDTMLGVINLPGGGVYDMDVYKFQGPATIKVVLYDSTKWPCALLLKEYDQANDLVPAQESYTHSIKITKTGMAKVSVQKANEQCNGIVPYKIVKTP